MLTTKKIMLLLASGAMILSATTSLADGTATITDNSAPHSAYFRWDQFSTDLQAVPNHPPVSDQETTVTGPTYDWSIIGQTPTTPGFRIIGSDDSGTATLQSAMPSKTINFIEAGGLYDITVKCVLKYIRTDNLTQQATPLYYRGVLDVKFWVVVPENVIEYNAKNHQMLDNGHRDIYFLKMVDNQDQNPLNLVALEPQSYSNGLPTEDFSIIKFSTDALVTPYLGPDPAPNEGGPSTLGLDVDGQGWDTGTGNPSAFFVDVQQVNFLDPATGIPVNPHFPNGNEEFVNEYDQSWYCMELTPPYNVPGAYNYLRPHQYHINIPTPPQILWPGANGFLANVNSTELKGGHGSTHHVKNTYGYARRTYPGDPYND